MSGTTAMGGTTVPPCQMYESAPGTRPADAAGERDVHMGEPGFFHKLIRAKQLEGLFLFVTSQCNSKCRTCFYHENLNARDDLTFEQMDRISATAPKFDKLWLSGGEPFMRKDLVEIIKLFYDRNGVRVINLPTNGLLGERIVAETRRLLDLCPELSVHLNFSIDGLGDVHDANRGVPGGFAKTIAAMEASRRAFAGNPRLLQNVATVVTPPAYDQLMDLGAYLLKKDLVGTQYFEVPRGNPRDPKTKVFTRAQVQAMHDRVFTLYEAQAMNLFKDFTGLKGWFARFFFLGFLRFMSDVQAANVEGPADWGMACVAGQTTFVIDANGDFRSCEMRPPIGNLRDYGYDLSAALHSAAMKREIEAIGGGWKANCWCTHGCWVMSSVKFSPRSLLFRIPAAYRRQKKRRVPGVTVPAVDVAAIEAYQRKGAKGPAAGGSTKRS